MEEKINFRFLFIGLLSILLTAISITLVFRSKSKKICKTALESSPKTMIFSLIPTCLRYMPAIKCVLP